MFAPVFSISHKILSNLIGIELNTKLVELAPLSPDWEIKLKKESLIRRSSSLLRFVGNDLDANAISKIIDDEPGRDDKAHEVALRTGVVGKEKNIQQVLNWINANRLVEQVAYLSGKFKQSDYAEKELTQINTLIGEKLIDPDLIGKYRDIEIEKDGITDIPRVVEVPYQMDDLFLWFRSASRHEIHPILKAGIMLYELMRITPFLENNLQTCVDYFYLILAGEGYGQKQMLACEEELFKNKESFYRLFSDSSKEGVLTVWLEYVTKELLTASEKTKTKVMNLVGDAPIFKSESGRVISLTERQIVIMEEITVKNEMTIREIRSLLPVVSDDTILRDLKDLIDKKLIKKRGKTKGAIYLLGKMKSFK